MTADFHLAQVNIARARAPIDSPVMAVFVALLEEINALWWIPAGHLPTVEEAKQRPPGGSLPVLDPTLEATCR